MSEVDEAELVAEARDGSGRAFHALLQRYDQRLAAQVQREARTPEDAEDILQETLLQAWMSLRHLQQDERFGPWILQIARHRCRDFYRASQRRDATMEPDALEGLVNRYGRPAGPPADTELVLEALEAVPEAARETARLFYLDGFTIREIAERQQRPEGTVKRRLHDARSSMRVTLDVTRDGRRSEMSGSPKSSASQPFPERRPEIVIRPTEQTPFGVSCPELRWWCIVPELRCSAAFAQYDPPGWSVSRVYALEAVRSARVHEAVGVEIEVREWKAAAGWRPTQFMYGRGGDGGPEYLAVSFLDSDQDRRTFYTYQDADFSWDWGKVSLTELRDEGRVREQDDGALVVALGGETSGVVGAGLFNLRVGPREEPCLRVFDIGEDPQMPGSSLIEAYLNRDGRTLLIRRYCRPDRPNTLVDEQVSRVVNGVRFVHWYDTLPNLACGL